MTAVHPLHPISTLDTRIEGTRGRRMKQSHSHSNKMISSIGWGYFVRLIFIIACLVLHSSECFNLECAPTSAIRRARYKGSVVVMLSSSSKQSTCSNAKNNNNNKKALYPWREARRIARGHGFSSKQEFIDYECPGAYQLPKNPDEVWKDDWISWEDWLGICLEFEAGRDVARKLNVKTEEEYLKLFTDKLIDDDDIASRLPYRPDLKYKTEWQGWDDWLIG